MELKPCRFTGPWKSITEAEQWIQETTNGPRSLIFTIFLKEEPGAQKIIGLVGLNRWDKIHYMLHPKFWGSGYCSEALGAFLIALFRHQPKRLSIGTVVSSDNIGSLRVLEKCGFVPDAPKTSVSMPTTAEISEHEELYELKYVVKNSGLPDGSLLKPVRPTAPKGRVLYYRYVKPATN